MQNIIVNILCKKNKSLQAKSEVRECRSSIPIRDIFYTHTKNRLKAIQCLTKAAEQGHARAQAILSLYYEKIGNTEKAHEYHNKAQQQGFFDQFNIE